MGISSQPLKGRVALVTGGSRGIGAGITRKLASWGCKVCVNYVDRHGPAKKLAKELNAQGGEISLHCADIAIPGEIERLMSEIGALHGQLNILVHNAAANQFSRLEDSSLGQWEFTQDTNARSTWLLAKHALPWMEHREGARYITITNSTPHRIIQSAGVFAAAKSSLEVLTSYLAYEYAPYGIVVNCLRPGLVRTGVFSVRPDFEFAVEHEYAISPWGNNRMTTVEDCGDAVAMLCLDEAKWIAGQLITLDGGYRHWCNLREPESVE
ncbi:SDR family NAD(P)-dependent oxidoreductase [Dyella flagellata]|uniref:3-ketoacyl-ACP reductase n=1 Tax=Dyella flagellata TaxID=1867833 RepID=A0ABQ5XBE8_9GAMM|nr:SDR family oxidoreductase [Dyella flagellata]GLQ87936.1 3-ketoacyl-ACP reductase [Dyella flagellata]